LKANPSWNTKCKIDATIYCLDGGGGGGGGGGNGGGSGGGGGCGGGGGGGVGGEIHILRENFCLIFRVKK